MFTDRDSSVTLAFELMIFQEQPGKKRVQREDEVREADRESGAREQRHEAQTDGDGQRQQKCRRHAGGKPRSPENFLPQKRRGNNMQGMKMRR